jgi:hypothetical protein
LNWVLEPKRPVGTCESKIGDGKRGIKQSGLPENTW